MLGARSWTVYRRVTLPLIGPSLAAGMALCWARALGDFGATITFAGNLPGRTQTMPLAVYLLLESDPAAAYVLSLLLLMIASWSWCCCAAATSRPPRHEPRRRRPCRARHAGSRGAFTVADGEVVGLVGPNGAGKSTLLRAIAGPRTTRWRPHRAARADAVGRDGRGPDRGAPRRSWCSSSTCSSPTSRPWRTSRSGRAPPGSRSLWRGTAPRSGWGASGWGIAPRRALRSSRAGSSNASRWRGRWPRARLPAARRAAVGARRRGPPRHPRASCAPTSTRSAGPC